MNKVTYVILRFDVKYHHKNLNNHTYQRLTKN